MIQRCTNKNRKDYKHYWLRWIVVCDKRKKFEWFIDDMYKSWSEWLELDRIDNNWNYCKENCRWATRKEQNNNQRSNHLITYKWKTQTLAQWAEEYWLVYGTLINRINTYWWTVEQSLTTPVKRNNYYIKKIIPHNTHFIEYKWKKKSIKEWAKYLWFSCWSVISNRINTLWRTIEDALTIPTKRNEYHIYKKNKKKN
jgi:hypothetical protein